MTPEEILERWKQEYAPIVDNGWVESDDTGLVRLVDMAQAEQREKDVKIAEGLSENLVAAGASSYNFIPSSSLPFHMQDRYFYKGNVAKAIREQEK